MSAAARVKVRAAAIALGIALSASARGGDDQEVREDLNASGRLTLQERPFSFLVDPPTPSAGVATMAYAFGLGSGVAADRPIPVNLVSSTGSHTFTVGYGLTHRLAPFASATITESAAGATGGTSTVSAGLAYQLTRPGAPLRVTLSAAGVHEGATGASGLSTLAAARWAALLEVGAEQSTSEEGGARYGPRTGGIAGRLGLYFVKVALRAVPARA